MPVTITAAQLAVAIGIIGAEDEDIPAGTEGILTRELGVASSLVAAIAPAAPDAIQDEAVVRLVGWLHDSDPASARPMVDPVIGSGAGALLARWRRQALQIPAGGVAPGAPSAGGGVDAAAVNALIAAALAAYQPVALGEELYDAFVGASLPAPGDFLRVVTVDQQARRITLGSIAPETSAHDGDARAGVASNLRLLRRLQDVTTDLHAGPESTAWADAADDAEGGIAAVDTADLAHARAVTDWTAQSLDHEGGKHTVARIPIDTDPRLARMKVEGSAGQVYYESLSSLVRLGASTDGMWALYYVGTYGDAVTTVTLQVTGSLAHLGETVFDGVLGDGAAGIRGQLGGLAAVTADLHAGPTPTGWVDATATAQGGIAVGQVAWTLANMRALSASDWKLNATRALDMRYHAVRLPAGTDPRQARVAFSGYSGSGYHELVNRLTLLGQSADAQWDLYADNGDRVGSGVLALTLQVTASAAHVGQSVFSGKLGAGVVTLDALAAAVAARLLPVGGSDGQFVARAAGSPAWVAAPGGGGGLAVLSTVAWAVQSGISGQSFSAKTGISIPESAKFVAVTFFPSAANPQSTDTTHPAASGTIRLGADPGATLTAFSLPIFAPGNSVQAGGPYMRFERQSDGTYNMDFIISSGSIPFPAAVQGRIEFWG